MAIDADTLARDTAALVAIPSVTGSELAVLERLGELAAGLGLDPELREHDLAALRAHPGHPGEEAEREELFGLAVMLPGSPGGPRLALDGHVDVVAPGTEEWRLGPWSGAVEDGCVHGRGSVDMKGAGWRCCTRWRTPAGATAARWCCTRWPPRRTAAWAPLRPWSATRVSMPA